MILPISEDLAANKKRNYVYKWQDSRVFQDICNVILLFFV